MSNIIDSIKLSGVTYTIQGSGGGGNPTVEVTQAEYDAMVTAGTVSADTYYIITDAQAGDLTQYWTSAQTMSAITEATSGKVDSNVYTAYTASTDTAIQGKQDTLVSGTNIKTINNESLLGSGNITIQGGGGSSYTAGDGIDITNNVISVTGKADTSAVTAIQDSLSGYVTTNTEQDITATKTFVNTEKGIIFKQKQNANKIGFSLISSASTNNEVATFEFRPNTYTDSSSVSHPLLYLGHYRTTAIANNGIVQTMVGFRQYDQSNSAAYHYLMPLPADAKTPFSLTTSFKNYFAPLGFKNGDTMIKTDNTGVADFSDVLGGLKLVKLSQSEYDSLATKDNSTLYVIVN